MQTVRFVALRCLDYLLLRVVDADVLVCNRLY